MSSSDSSKLSTTEMQLIVERLKSGRHRLSTQKSYRNIWKNFNKFFIRLDIKPQTWEERIVLFTGFLIEQNKQSSTIKSYISAIRAVLQEDGVVLDENKFLITSLTRACKLKNDRVQTRLPIQKGLLHILMTRMEDLLVDQPYLQQLYKTIFATAYYGLLRIGEVTTGSHPILAKDVYVADNKKKILLILRSSKTHNLGDPPQLVKISSTPLHHEVPLEKNLKANSKQQSSGKNENSVKGIEKRDEFCPYQLLRTYFAMRGPYGCIKEPFFIFRDRSPVTPIHVRKYLREALKTAGFDETLYCTHGFRAGRSVDLLKIGLSVESIRKIGRWSSSAIYTYLKTY